MCLPHVFAWGLFNLVGFLEIRGQVHWNKKCSKCAQPSGAYAVCRIVMIDRRFSLGQSLPDFGETGLDIVVGPLRLE